MGSIGDIYATVRLDTAGFSGGVVAAQQQAAKLGQQLELFRAPVAAAAVEVQNVGEAAKTMSGHFELSSRVMARFASMGVQELVPSLQGSRLALEGVFQTVSRLAGGWGTLILAGVGAATFLGGYFYNAMTKHGEAAKGAAAGVKSLDEQINQFTQDLPKNRAELERMENTLARLQRQGAGGIFIKSTGLAAARAAADPETLTTLQSFAALQEMVKTEPKKAWGEALDKVRDLNLATRVFLQTANEAAVTDPLQKMLVADWHRAQELIDKWNELKALNTSDLFQDIANQRIGEIGAAGGQRQVDIRNAANFAGGAKAAAALGMNDSSILAGLDAIKDLNRETEIYQGNIKRMVEAGISQRDIENEIQLAQTKVDATLAELNKRFADTPAILDLMKTSFSKLEFGQFARDLGSTLTGLDAFQKTSGDFIAVIGDMAPVVRAADGSLVTFVGDVYALAAAIQYAAEKALFFNAAVGPSANFGAAPLASQ